MSRFIDNNGLRLLWNDLKARLAANPGSPGTSWWHWNTAGNLTNISSVAGSKIGDYFVNTGTAARTILGVSTAIGGVVRSTSATQGTAAGSIRGTAGADGTDGISPSNLDWGNFININGWGGSSGGSVADYEYTAAKDGLLMLYTSGSAGASSKNGYAYIEKFLNNGGYYITVASFADNGTTRNACQTYVKAGDKMRVSVNMFKAPETSSGFGTSLILVPFDD